MVYNAVNFQEKVTFSSKFCQTYLMHSINYTYDFPFRNISSGTKVELELNLTEKSNITSRFLYGKAKDSRMSFLMSFFLLSTIAKGQSTIEHY